MSQGVAPSRAYIDVFGNTPAKTDDAPLIAVIKLDALGAVGAAVVAAEGGVGVALVGSAEFPLLT